LWKIKYLSIYLGIGRPVSEFGYLAVFLDAGGSELSDVENDAKFCTFCPPPVKISGGVGEISIPIIEALPMTEPPEHI